MEVVGWVDAVESDVLPVSPKPPTSQVASGQLAVDCLQCAEMQLVFIAEWTFGNGHDEESLLVKFLGQLVSGKEACSGKICFRGCFLLFKVAVLDVRENLTEADLSQRSLRDGVLAIKLHGWETLPLVSGYFISRALS